MIALIAAATGLLWTILIIVLIIALILFVVRRI
jgi:hypothetical protein